MIWLVLLLGCPKKNNASEAQVTASQVEADEQAARAEKARGRPIGGGPWMGGSLTLEVPSSGWTAIERAGPHVLSMHHEETGIDIEVYDRAVDGDVGPRSRKELWCTWEFKGRGRWRSIDLGSGEVLSATCVPDDEVGRLLQGYYAPLGGREVQIEVFYPPGTYIRGQKPVRDVLKSVAPRAQ